MTDPGHRRPRELVFEAFTDVRHLSRVEKYHAIEGDQQAPFHTLVYVVTHEKRDPWERPGGIRTDGWPATRDWLDQAADGLGGSR